MKRITLGLLLLAVLLLAACGGATSGNSVTHTIEMTEYAFSPSNLELNVGDEVTLKLVNNGTLEHELMIGRDIAMMNNRPAGYQIDFFALADEEPTLTNKAGEEIEHGHAMHSGFMAAVPPGDEVTMTFTVNDEMVGEWEIGCFLLDGVHYDSGMKGTLTVKP